MKYESLLPEALRNTNPSDSKSYDINFEQYYIKLLSYGAGPDTGRHVEPAVEAAAAAVAAASAAASAAAVAATTMIY